MSNDEADGNPKPVTRKVLRIESFPQPQPMPPEDVPSEFTDEWLDTLTPGQLTWLERQRDSLSEGQKGSLSAYTSATIGETLQRIQDASRDSFARLADALSRPPSPVSEALNRQEEATKRLVESLRPIEVSSRGMAPLQASFAAKAKRRAERDRRERALVELTATVADSTRVLAKDVNGQKGLTWLLAVAVLFDILNGTFEDPSVRSAVFSLSVAIATVILCAEIGRWAARTRKNASKAD